jgi:hypothetical protein
LLNSSAPGLRTPGKKVLPGQRRLGPPSWRSVLRDGWDTAFRSPRLRGYSRTENHFRPGAVGRNQPIEGYRAERREASGPDRTDLHVQNFIECVRSRKEPAATVESGHRASIVAHLGNIAYRTGRKIRWDSEKEQIVNDLDASKFLWREPRKQWDVI